MSGSPATDVSSSSGPEGPRPRAIIAQVPAYVPGRPPTPRADRPTYKLSSNENAFPAIPAVLAAAEQAAAGMNRYPDMGCSALSGALSERLGVPTSWLAAGTGSVAVLYHLLQAFCDPGDEVIYAWRSFEAYPIAVTVSGAVSVPVPLGTGARHDLDAMADAVTERTRAVLVCTPNNPTGPAVTHTELTRFVDRVPARVLVVVDEAYADFVRSEDPVDALSLCRERGNVVVMRTFAKAAGLAGLRVGYLAAPEHVAAAVRACSLPFGVSGVAQAAAVASLGCAAEIAERVDSIVGERTRVLTGLRAQGWEIPDAQGNFCWFQVGERATEFAAAAEAAGIIVRPFAGDGVRASIGEPAANDVLLEVAEAFRAAS